MHCKIEDISPQQLSIGILIPQNMSEEGQATASAAKPVDDPGMFCMSFKHSQSPTPLS